MEKAKNLTEVVVIMISLNYNFIGEERRTINSKRQYRNMLFFEKRASAKYLPIRKEELQKKIGNYFSIEEYDEGKYYHIYRNL